MVAPFSTIIIYLSVSDFTSVRLFDSTSTYAFSFEISKMGVDQSLES